METLSVTSLFDVIFCRNVMIYFDKETQGKLIDRFYGCLKEGGYFFVGHSESLTGLEHRFQYIEPSVYRK
jgi:chemotaxis protein methyltransferase CheR